MVWMDGGYGKFFLFLISLDFLGGHPGEENSD